MVGQLLPVTMGHSLNDRLEPNLRTKHQNLTRCGFRVPNLMETAVADIRTEATLVGSGRPKRQEHRRIQIQTCDQLCDQCIEIDVNLHMTSIVVGQTLNLIPHPTDIVNRINQGGTAPGIDQFSTPQEIGAIFQANIDVVNQAYSGTPFRFRFAQERTTVTENTAWAYSLQDYQTGISALVGSGDLTQLDVFLGFSLGSSEGDRDALGLASTPAFQRAGTGDGVFLRYDVLTGGGMEGLDGGFTLVHEIGQSNLLSSRSML